MRLGFVQYRALLVVVFVWFVLSSPTMGDALSEAMPMPQNQPINPEVKPEQKQETSNITSQKPKAKSTTITPVSTSTSAMEEESSSNEPNDPLEPLNRLIFGLNEVLDVVFLRPIAEIYRAITPEPMRNGVRNVLDNLYTPVSFLNHILQAEAERATVTFFRFLMNSSFGIGGLVDVTSELGYPRYDTDFNQTLTAWGVDTGPYLVLPIIGSSSFRGSVGLVADYYSDPLNLYLNNRHHWKYHYLLTVRYGFDIVSRREKVIETIDNIRSGSLDTYVTMRSIYFQRQAYMAEKLKSANAPEMAKEEGKPNAS